MPYYKQEENTDQGLPGSGLPDIADLPSIGKLKAPPAPKPKDPWDSMERVKVSAPPDPWDSMERVQLQPQPEMGLGEEVKREFKGGVYTFGSSAMEGLGRLAENEGLRQYGRELAAKREAETAPLRPMEIDYTDPRFLARSTASLVGSTVAPLAAGGAAALAAPALGLGTLGATALTAGVAGAMQFPASVGEVSREYQEATGGELGKGKAVGYGTAHAALGTLMDVATLRIGGLIPGGKSIMGKLASRIVDPWWKTVGKAAVGGGIAESVEEAGQKLISGAPVAQAKGESWRSPERLGEATQEFLYALPGSILLGGVAGGVGAAKAKSDLKTLESATQNPEARKRVANIVAQELVDGGRDDLARAWSRVAADHIANKKALPLLKADSVNEIAAGELQRRGDILPVPESEREGKKAPPPDITGSQAAAPGRDLIGAKETGSTQAQESEAIAEQQARATEAMSKIRDLKAATPEGMTPTGKRQGKVWDEHRAELTSLGLDPSIVDDPTQSRDSIRKTVANAKRAKSVSDRVAASEGDGQGPLDASQNHPQATVSGEGQLTTKAPPPTIIKNAPSIKVFRGVPKGTNDAPGNTTFYTTDPSFASTFHQAYAGTGEADVTESNISPKRIWDFRDTNDVVAIMPEVIEKVGGAQAAQLQRGIELGDWGAIEHPAVREAIKNADYDAFTESESGALNIGVLNDANIEAAFASPRPTREPDRRFAWEMTKEEFVLARNIYRDRPGDPWIIHDRGRDISAHRTRAEAESEVKKLLERGDIGMDYFDKIKEGARAGSVPRAVLDRYPYFEGWPASDDPKASPRSDRMAADIIKQQMVAARPKFERRVPENASRREMIDRAISEQREISGQRATISQLMAMSEAQLRELLLSEPEARASARPVSYDIQLVRRAHAEMVGSDATGMASIVEYTGKLTVEQGVAIALGEAMGIKTIFAVNMQVDGLSLGNNTIVLATDNSRPVMFLLGHEMFHSILRDIRRSGSQNLNAELDQFIKFVMSAYTAEERARWEEVRVAGMSEIGFGEDADVINEEFWADVFGRVIHSKDFLPRLRTKDAALYAKFVSAIKDAIDRVLKAIGFNIKTTDDAALATFYRDENYTPEDVRRAIDATVKLVSAYARERGVSKAGNADEVRAMVKAYHGGPHRNDEAMASPRPQQPQRIPVYDESATPMVNMPPDRKLTTTIIKYVDKHYDLKRIVGAIEQYISGTIADHIDPYLQITTAPGTSTAMRERFFEYQADPAFRFMQENDISIKEMEKHLVMVAAGKANVTIAKRNKKLNVLQDGGSGVWNDEIREYFDALDPAKQKLLDQAAGQWHTIQENMRQLLIGSGVKSREEIVKWISANGKEYVPFHREDMEDPAAGGRMSGGGANPFSQRRMGSELPVVNVIGHIIHNYEMAIEAAAKNRVRLATYGMFGTYSAPQVAMSINPELANKGVTQKRVVTALQGIGMSAADAKNVWDAAGNNREAFFDEVTAMGYTEENAFDAWSAAVQDYINTNPTMQQHIQELQSLGLKPDEALYIFAPPKSRAINPQTGQVEFRANPMTLQRDNVVVARLNGEKRYVVFNATNPQATRMARNIKNMDDATLQGGLANLNKITRLVAAMATQWDVFFGPFNLLRDVGTMSLNLTNTPLAGKQAEILKNIPKFVFEYYRDTRAERRGQAPGTPMSRLAAQHRGAGGTTGYKDVYENRGERIKDVYKRFEQMKNATPKAKMRNLMKSMGDWLSDYNDSFENATRLAVFKAALDAGMSEQRAAALSKEITVNFNRKGTNSAQLNALFAFANASIQGTAQMYRTLTGQAGRRIVYGGMLLGALQAAMLVAAGYDDDDLSAWIKDRGFIIPSPFGEKGKYIAVPLPLGFNVLPAMGRNIMDFFLFGPEKYLEKFLPNTFNSMADALSPLGPVSTSVQTILPTVADPWAAISENLDYAQRPISRRDFNANKATPGYARSKNPTTPWGVGIAKAINMLTGGGWQNAMVGALSPTADDIDYLISQAGGGVARSAIKVGKVIHGGATGEPIPTYNYPVVGRLYGNIKESYNESNRFYNNMREMQQMRLELEDLKADRKPTANYYKKHPTARLIVAAKTAYNDVAKLNGERTSAMERKVPRERIKAIEERIAARKSRFNDLVRSVKKEAP